MLWTNNISANTVVLPAEEIVSPRDLLDQLRSVILSVAPAAVEEGGAFGLVAFHWKDRPLVYIGVEADGCSVYPADPDAIAAHQETLAEFEVDGTIIRLRAGDPAPVAFLRKLINERIAERAS